MGNDGGRKTYCNVSKKKGNLLLLLAIVRCGDQVSTRCYTFFVKKKEEKTNPMFLGR